MKTTYIILSAVFISFFSGCSAVLTGYQEELDLYSSLYNTHSCDMKFIDSKIKSKHDLILWSELGGSLERDCKNYIRSNSYFDMAEELYKQNDLENLFLTSLKNIAVTTINENIASYEGNTYEAIMINTYKALNFISLNDFANARVEFNRALDRQRRAKDEFAGRIRKEQEKLKKEDQKNLKIAKNPKTVNRIDEYYLNNIFFGFRAYPDFINPFATYMAALFFIVDSDYLKARELLKESVAMQPENLLIKEDFELVDRILKGLESDKYIWLIYENGKSMAKDEFRLDIPLFLTNTSVVYAGIALPTLSERNSSYKFLSIGDQNSKVIADMDNVIKSEFKAKLPMIVTRAVLRTVVKTILQKKAYDENEYAGLAVALFNLATNIADTRSWVSLPKNFQALRVKNIGEAIDVVTPQGKVIERVFIPKDKNGIIYVRSSALGYHASHKITF